MKLKIFLIILLAMMVLAIGINTRQIANILNTLEQVELSVK